MGYRKYLIDHDKELDARKRRIGKDKKELKYDIHIYRHFFCFLKLALDYEDTGIKKGGKLVKYKVDRKIYKNFDLDEIKKLPKFLTMSQNQITTNFNKFFKKYREQFLEQENSVSKITKSIQIKENDNNLYLKISPAKESVRNIISQVRKLIKKNTPKKTYQDKSTASLKFTGVPIDSVMLRYIKIFRLKETTKLKNTKIAEKVGVFSQGDIDKKSVVLKYFDRTKSIILNVAKGIYYSMQ